MIVAPWRLALLLLPLLAAPAAAQAPLCFCLAERGTEFVTYRNCTEATPPTGGTPVAQCTDLRTGAIGTIRDVAAFDRLPAGEAGCNPCRPRISLDDRETRPRGEDEDDEAATQ
ncbi:hypothetical protein [Salinarimonas sp.]|uniref:hypothetical protein n=1 Tax=Salinarimonas sp. TaxID=2766526 RepID=UPI0032D9764F